MLLMWAGILALLALIAPSDYLPLGPYLPWVQFAAAAAIVAMLTFFWMQLATATAAVRIAAFAAIFFLFVLTILAFNDYPEPPHGSGAISCPARGGSAALGRWQVPT